MKLDTNDLSLFGYDLGNTFAWLRLAWRELLWDSNSPILNSLQEPVQLFDAVDGQRLGVYRGDQQLAGVGGTTEAKAVCLPEDQVLTKRLRLPESLEAELDDVMSLELAANSPFPEDESAMGWQLVEREGEFLIVDLLIVHKSDARQAMASLSELNEVWASLPSGYAVIRGFGEELRQRRYIRRVKWLAAKMVMVLVLLCVMPAMVSGFRYVQMEKVQDQFHELKQSAVPAIQARETLGKANELMSRFNTLINKHPDPVSHLMLLTQEAGDDVWLRSFNLKGLKLQITGYASNATEFIQQLSLLPQFQQVKQRGGIRRDNASGSEVFTLDITLNPTYRVQEGVE